MKKLLNISLCVLFLSQAGNIKAEPGKLAAANAVSEWLANKKVGKVAMATMSKAYIKGIILTFLGFSLAVDSMKELKQRWGIRCGDSQEMPK